MSAEGMPVSTPAFAPAVQINTAPPAQPRARACPLPNEIEPCPYLVKLFRVLPLATTADDYAALLRWKMRLPASR
ncbi:transposase domain-containing protein [Herbaspirillum sp. ST 5-3]|uniref:transposase domain-containing protein n=1 Tax=Oxalobacteraceae TaxID=75682 RepID=UPI001B3B6219|nr:transposase domain-containing protein [Herbaspirillum sp. ST 5-3]